MSYTEKDENTQSEKEAKMQNKHDEKETKKRK